MNKTQEKPTVSDSETVSLPLVEEIKKRAADDRLIPGVHVELQCLKASTVDDVSVVQIEFRVPQERTATSDPTTGVVSIASSGPVFTYTFIDNVPEDVAFEDLNAFYAKRSKTAFSRPTVRRSSKKKHFHFALQSVATQHH